MSEPTNQLGTSSPILSYFCVYNPSLGPDEESAHEQILYYTAKSTVTPDVKMKHVGLAQALVNFAATFPTSNPVQTVHSQKHRMVFFQPEPGFWMHMCIELGILRKQINSKGKEKLVTEYLDSQLNNRALEGVLKIGYEQFKLLNGTFASILYENGEFSRQRARALSHTIEEFFAEWIWKWDFDRLDIMTFDAVFNGVPLQSIQRNNYLRVHETEQELERFGHCHLFILDYSTGSLVYKSSSLLIQDVQALRKYVIKRVDKQVKAEKMKLDYMKKEPKASGLKSITKTISPAHFLNYFQSGSKSTDSAGSTNPSIESTVTNNTTSSESQGMFLTGLVESTAIGMNGEERIVTKTDLVRVYLLSKDKEDQEQENKLYEYYLITYKHKSNLIWNLLLPVSVESEDLITDALFYHDLQQCLIDKDLELLTTNLLEDISTMQAKSFNLGKHYKCLFYDNTTLNMKSTLTKKTMTNDIFLQLLEVKDDFDKASSKEIYTRSTTNYWIAGNRVYHNGHDYTELYLIASKKDTSLAEVEETLGKMTNNLADVMHIE